MRKKNKGFILIFVLGFSLILTSVVLFFNYKTKKYLESFKNYYDFIEMDRISDIGFEIAKKILEKDENNYDWIKENWTQERNYKIGNYDLYIKIEDENSKININKIIGEKGKTNQLLLEILKNLISIVEYPTFILDCLLDWIDEDNLPRPNGAEDLAYSIEGLSYTPPNRNLLSLKELLLIKGFNKEIVYGKEEKKGLLDFITIYSDDKINVNTCKSEILNSIGFTTEQVNRIIEERENRPLNERFLLEINRNTFLKNKSLIKYKSNYFHVFIKIKNEKGDEKITEGILKKDKTTNLIKKDVI
ncbi:MAG: general secretion pathway protein GspK [Candidatus Omnitrophica bacterium]|nr:general secretion pathway protein GspK [Candidatus Omnitrophota bacterium]MCM8801876.1 general secretion pathway protein GspK [Candidatus Omnitrophota bacterium]